MTYRPTRAELEYYASAKPRTRRECGYFKDGQLTRGPFYSACLGKKVVGIAHGSYNADSGMYLIQDDALQAAKLFQEKMREMLAKGEFA